MRPSFIIESSFDSKNWYSNEGQKGKQIDSNDSISGGLERNLKVREEFGTLLS
jgi:hypothetical protein